MTLPESPSPTLNTNYISARGGCADILRTAVVLMSLAILALSRGCPSGEKQSSTKPKTEQKQPRR